MMSHQAVSGLKVPRCSDGLQITPASVNARLILSEATGVSPQGEAGEGADDLATGKPGRKPIHPQHLARLISQHATEDAIFTFVVGTPSIWAPRYLKMNGRRRSTAGRAVNHPAATAAVYKT